MSRLLIIFVLASWAIPVLARDTQPNVIIVITDDQGYGDVGAHGNTMIQTPNLDQLHTQSVRLTDYHVDPTCSPTRSALMTGRYSTRTGVWHTIMGRSLMNTQEYTIAEVFRDGGYKTGMFGKWHLGDNYPVRPQDQGFDYTFIHGGGGVGQGPDYWGNDYFDDTYWRNGKPEPQKGYCTDVWFDDALDFIERNRKKPFFAYISTNAPHGPYLVSEQYSNPYKEKGVGSPQAEFYGMIENIDDNIGKLTKKLDDLQIADNTILIFTTDNGSAAGWRSTKNGTWKGYNAGMRAGKGSNYDGGHRVPMFIRWPDGKLTGGRDVDTLCAHIDVLPTLSELCGLEDERAEERDGESLKSVLYGDKNGLRDRTILVHSQRVENVEKYRNYAVLTERWRLLNQTQLYDIKADPGQQNNIYEEHPEIAKELSAAYEAWWKSLSSSFDLTVRIGIGYKPQPESLLHSHDWHTNNTRTPWHQNHVRSGDIGNGFWALDVAETGKYRIELCRWPRQESKAMDAVKATIEIGGQTVTQEIAEGEKSVVFNVELQKGGNDLLTKMELKDGKVRGSYFAYIKRVK
ncbi:MAG: N-acetylgalactosamine 6-sulfate sulfatase [Planctomycetaceae bacterium]|nr:N-acetylgalactosamine 6-sulfate sulfatase [Planctomycetaceae bacterium]